MGYAKKICENPQFGKKVLQLLLVLNNATAGGAVKSYVSYVTLG
jgi:hypothetical protein